MAWPNGQIIVKLSLTRQHAFFLAILLGLLGSTMYLLAGDLMPVLFFTISLRGIGSRSFSLFSFFRSGIDSVVFVVRLQNSQLLVLLSEFPKWRLIAVDALR